VATIGQAVQKPKSKGRRLVAWSLWVFAGGLGASPLVADHADQGLEAGIAWLATWAPSFLRPYLPAPLQVPTPPDHRSSVAVATGAAAPAAAERARPAEAPAQPKPAPELSAKQTVTRAPTIVPMNNPAAPERPATQTQPRPARGTHRKVAATEPEASPPIATARSTGHKPGETSDPFDSDGRRTAEPVAKEPVAKEPAEAAPVKSSPAKSSGSLDDLMAGVASGSAGKPNDRHNTSKEIDAMLKGVQKSEPAPPPKHAEPASLPPLTAADIAKAMAGVKTDAAACGKRFGQNGTADLKLTVGKDGQVTDVALRGKLVGLPIAQCVVKAARGAAFPRNAGLKFDYRIDVQ
jgi:hypothetical protein